MTLQLNYRMVVVLSMLGFLSFHAKAQNSNENLTETILALDAKFWKAYNSCDLESFQTFLTDDLEFFHDKDGLTKSSSKLMEQIANGLCRDKNTALRREAIKGSVKVYPLNNYGAIISGEHLFYLTEGNKKERLVERALFTHVWKSENKVWKMSRVLSYDHQNVSKNSFKQGTELDQKSLAAYVGNYKAPNTGLVKIYLSESGKLTMDAGRMKAELHFEKGTTFFIKEAPIALEFVKNSQGKVSKFIVKENGNPVEEATKVD